MSKSKRQKSGAQSDEHVRAVQERRRSNAASTHGDRRTKRNRTRDAQKRNAIKEND